MFPVVIIMPDEDVLAARLDTMWAWLDLQHFEPPTFRYTFASRGILFRVEFTVEAQALAFATAFGGQLP
jgi:hypothetical protein